MAEESSNLFDAVRKANRLAWEQASGRKSSGDKRENPFDAVRKANRLAWEQASGRKSGGDNRSIPPATGLESNLDGFDNSAMISALSAKLSALESRIDYIEDDFPERDSAEASSSADAVSTYSLSVSKVAGNTISCTGGVWTHKLAQHWIPAKDFWFGAAGNIPDGAIQLSAGNNYAYVEIPGNTTEGLYWGVASGYPESSTTYLRRCVFHVELEDVSGTLVKIGDVSIRNSGDIYS